ESERGDESEAGISSQHPQAVPQILKECLDESYSTHLAMGLLQQCDVSELAARGPSGLGLGHPLADISLGEQAQVRIDLVVELSIRSAIPEQSPKSRRQNAQIVDHVYSYSFRRLITRMVTRIAAAWRGRTARRDELASCRRARPQPSALKLRAGM